MLELVEATAHRKRLLACHACRRSAPAQELLYTVCAPNGAAKPGSRQFCADAFMVKRLPPSCWDLTLDRVIRKPVISLLVQLVSFGFEEWYPLRWVARQPKP